MDFLGGSVSGSRLGCRLPPIRIESWPVQSAGIIPKRTESCLEEQAAMKPDYSALALAGVAGHLFIFLLVKFVWFSTSNPAAK